MILAAMLLYMVTGSVLAYGSAPPQPSEVFETDVSLDANAPWLKLEIDTPGDIGQYASVAVDPSSGVTYVSYYDATNQRLRLARSDGLGPEDCGPNDEWSCHTVDSGADVGKYSSIAVNPQTREIGIAYHDATNGNLKYLRFENPRLLVHNIYTIDKGIEGVSKTGLHTSLTFSDEGKPFIAYYFENPAGVDALRFAYYSVTNGNCGYGYMVNKWRCDTIISGEGMGQYPSLVVRNNWDFHISFYNGSSAELWYARPVEGNGNCALDFTDMTCYGVAGGNDVGRYSSLYLDSAGDFHIAYYDATDKKLMYAVELASGVGNCGVLGSAQCDEIDSMPNDYHQLGISIAEDPAGYPAIAYQTAGGSLNLARPLAALGLPAGSGNCGPEDIFYLWSCKIIDLHGTWVNYRNADFASLDFNSAGLATIAYNGFITSTGGNLYVAQQRFHLLLPMVLNDH